MVTAKWGQVLGLSLGKVFRVRIEPGADQGLVTIMFYALNLTRKQS